MYLPEMVRCRRDPDKPIGQNFVFISKQLRMILISPKQYANRYGFWLPRLFVHFLCAQVILHSRTLNSYGRVIVYGRAAVTHTPKLSRRNRGSRWGELLSYLLFHRKCDHDPQSVHFEIIKRSKRYHVECRISNTGKMFHRLIVDCLDDVRVTFEIELTTFSSCLWKFCTFERRTDIKWLIPRTTVIRQYNFNRAFILISFIITAYPKLECLNQFDVIENWLVVGLRKAQFSKEALVVFPCPGASNSISVYTMPWHNWVLACNETPFWSLK